MDIYEYVAVLTSIIIGLSITQLLYGLAQIVQHPDRTNLLGTFNLGRIYVFHRRMVVVANCAQLSGCMDSRAIPVRHLFCRDSVFHMCASVS
jgi:hypothetical protein